MPLTPGIRLGAYGEVIAPIGSGGMGEVYRAHDSRLGRDVAIKVLPTSLSSDPASLARFEREAKAIGALNHPNIVNVHDTGTHEGITDVVMELLEGETLRARLQGAAAPTTVSTTTPKPGSGRGSQPHGLPRKKALDIAHQIAQGLAAAHARGIVHRDLKPENIFLTHDGRVKILDFGLARAVTQQIGEAQTQLSPSPAADSVPGMVLGTVGYMAPEQVRGQAADQRADIFAFGAVLYEMLTGERAFDGESPIETMSAILKADPLEQPVASVAISGPLEPLVRHCLEKQPDERFQSARDLAFQIQAIASGSLSTSTAERAVAPKQTWRVLLPAAAALALLAGGVFIGRATTTAPARAAGAIVLSAPMPEGVHVYRGSSAARSGGIAVSADGQRIAFVGQTESGPPQMYVRSLDSREWQMVPNTGVAQYPAWSPDGRRLAFETGTKLRTIAPDGSDMQDVADIGNPRSGPSWGEDGTILYHRHYGQALLRVSASGGAPAEALPALADDSSTSWSWFSAVWLPGGRRFLVARFAYFDGETKEAGIYAAAPDSKTMSLVVPGPISEVAVGDREIYYRRGAELIALPFDADAVKTTGPPRVISKRAAMVAAGGGTLVYYEPPGGISQGQRIVLISRSGAVTRQVGGVGTYRDLRLSPDGRMLAVTRAGETGVFSVWVYDLARNIDRQITKGRTVVAPGWTRDSRSILHGGTGSLVRVDLDSSGPPAVIHALGSFANVNDVTTDGRDVLVQLIADTGESQMAVVPLDGSAPPRRVGDADRGSPYASFSPDGQWIAFVGREGNARRLFVQRKSGQGARIPVTASPATSPRWRGDGREVYFLASSTGDPDMMMVPVTWTPNGPDFGAPQKLFTIVRYVGGNLGFDVTPDGKTFAVIVSDPPDDVPLTVRVRVKP